MSLYLFDTQDNGAVIIDDEGLYLPDFNAVKIQATRSLVELALDVLPGSIRRTLRVDVRDETCQPVLVTELVFEARVLIEIAG
jgi:hypothetical protein